MLNRVHDQTFPHVHRERERLQDEMVAVTIDDHTRKTVAFTPHHAAQLCIDISSIAVLGSLLDTPTEKIPIKILASPRETPRNNLRLGIVDGASNQMVFAVLERNHIAIRGFSENLEHFAGKRPVVSMQNSRTRFDDDPCHTEFNVQRSTPNVQRSTTSSFRAQPAAFDKQLFSPPRSPAAVNR